MKLYRSRQGVLAEHDSRFYAVSKSSWDDLLTREDLQEYLLQFIRETKPVSA